MQKQVRKLPKRFANCELRTALLKTTSKLLKKHLCLVKSGTEKVDKLRNDFLPKIKKIREQFSCFDEEEFYKVFQVLNIHKIDQRRRWKKL